MKQDFITVMSNRTDEELIKIVTVDRNDYQIEAIVAAEKELESRNIYPIKIESVKLDIIEKQIKEKEIESSVVSSWTRLIHSIVDFIAFVVLAFILSFIFELFFNPNDQFTIKLFGYIIILVTFFLYYVFMEFKFQKTLGKFITKTKVVMSDGRQPELSEIFVRTACRLIPLDNFSFLFTRNGFHDRLSNSTVIKEKN